jgi:hypothetical protein
MESTPRTESRDLIAVEQAPRRGPVALDPALLHHVVGGTDEEAAPNGRWLVLGEGDAGSVESAPNGRW